MNQETNTKEKILKKIRKALIEKTVGGINVDFDSDIYQKSEDPLEIVFAKELTKLNGKFIYCEDERELSESIASLIDENKWENVFCFEDKAQEVLNNAKVSFSKIQKDIRNANVGVSLCENLVARTGSVTVSYTHLTLPTNREV